LCLKQKKRRVREAPASLIRHVPVAPVMGAVGEDFSIDSLTAFIQEYEGGVYAIVISVVRLHGVPHDPNEGEAGVGLSDEQIHDAVEGTLFTDSAACSICIASHARRGSVRLRCGHCYHRTCISQWLQRADTCPMCRTRVLSEV
jgi:hypothetical protein